MTIKHTLKTAVISLKTHKTRSALTILGIVIGIAAIMLVMSLGGGAQQLILSEIQNIGSKTIAVAPGKEPKGPTDPSVIETFYGDSLKIRELEALKDKANIPKLAEIIPVVFGVEAASYERETFRPMIFGASDLITRIFNIFPEEGAFFTKEHIDSNAKVAVIGTEVKKELFGPSDAVGKKIKIKGQNIQVVGVLPKKGQVFIFNIDEAIIMPYTTAQQYIFGIKHFNRFIIQAESEADVPRTVADIERTLRELHNISDPENDYFFVATQAEAIETFKTVTDILTFFLVAVAAISLLVGSVGIMTMMLVSVTERTREIGLRKTLGATERNILFQFLIEAVIITASGGIIGILLGAFLSLALTTVLTYFMDISWPFSLPLFGAVLGLIVSAFIGLVFGLHPAYQASKKSPLEALRYE